MDLLTLELHATLAARLDAPAEAASGAGFEAAPAEDESEDDAEPAGTLKLAIDLDDGAAAAEPGTAPAEPAAS
jgi:exoribonuclease-2